MGVILQRSNIPYNKTENFAFSQIRDLGEPKFFPVELEVKPQFPVENGIFRSSFIYSKGIFDVFQWKRWFFPYFRRIIYQL